VSGLVGSRPERDRRGRLRCFRSWLPGATGVGFVAVTPTKTHRRLRPGRRMVRRRVCASEKRSTGFFRARTGYRFYNHDSGRWINRDPIREHGGLNIYVFCDNKPVNDWDVLGRAPASSGWPSLKKGDPGACDYGNIQFSASFFVDSDCNPVYMVVPAMGAKYKPCAIKTFAWPVNCVCKGMSDSPQDQCIRGCLQSKFDSSGKFPTVSDHLGCVNDCSGSSIAIGAFLVKLQPVNAARKVRRVGAPNRALEKCGIAPLKEHVCRHGRGD
jgi:RHS repeat-associated protein